MFAAILTFKKIDARFKKIDARFEKIDARFEKKAGKLQIIAHLLLTLQIKNRLKAGELKEEK